MYTTDTFASECFSAFDQFGVAFINYGVSVTDLEFIIYNIVYHIGALYDTVNEILTFY